MFLRLLLLLQVNAEARGRNCRMSFAFIYPDKNGRNVMRQASSFYTCMLFAPIPHNCVYLL